MPKEIYESPGTLEQKILADKNTDFLEVDRIVFDKGIFIHLKNHPYPQKGVPSTEACIYAINVAKSLVKEGLKALGIWILFLPKKRLHRAFCAIAWRSLEPYVLKYQFLTPCAQEVFTLLSTVTDERTAKILAHVIEYDQAYRFRLQDLANETSKEALIQNPRRELQRLIEISRERDYQEIADKVKLIGNLLTYALYFPKYKKLFIKAMKQSNFTKLQPDASDRYWMSQKIDYKYNYKTWPNTLPSEKPSEIRFG